MIRGYHKRVVAKADAAAQQGDAASVLGGIWRDAVIWTAPTFVAVVLCAALSLRGPSTLWLSLPAVGMAIFGGCLYVPLVYLAALKRQRNDS